MSEPSDLTLEEARDRARQDPTQANLELLAKKLVKEQHRADSSSVTTEFADELRELAEAHPDQPKLLELYSACLNNTQCVTKEAKDKDRFIAVLEQFRAIESGGRGTSVIVERYAIALNNAHVRAREWNDSDLGQYARQELARISEHPEASSRVIEFLATSLSDGHKRLHAAEDPTGARELLDQLEQLSDRYPSNRLVLTRLAGALAHEHRFARSGNDEELVLLRKICADGLTGSDGEEQLMLALSNAYVGLKEAVESDRAEALLEEARRLVEQSHSATARGYFGKMLRNKTYYLSQVEKFGLAEMPMQELLALQDRFAGEPAIVEQATAASKALSKKLSKAAVEHGSVQARADLRNLAVTDHAPAEALGAFARMLTAEVTESIGKKDIDRADIVLWELRSLQNANPDSEPVAAALVEGLSQRFRQGVLELDPTTYEQLEELRGLYVRYPASRQLVPQYLAALFMWQYFCMLKRRYDLFDAVLTEAQTIYRERQLSPPAAILYARIVSLGAGAAWAKLRIDRATILTREFNEVVRFCSSEARIADSLSEVRGSIPKNAWTFFQHDTMPPRPLLMLMLGMITGTLVRELILKPNHWTLGGR